MSTASAAVKTDRSATGNSAGVLAAIRQHRSNRPISICSDVEGRTTHNPQLIGRLLVLSHVELLTLAAYLESESGFSKANQQVLRDIDFLSRGGRIPIICGVDANKNKEAWDEVMWGDRRFLDHIDCEILEVTNGLFSCRGKTNEVGGSNTDDFIVSRCFLGTVVSALADFSSEW